VVDGSTATLAVPGSSVFTLWGITFIQLANGDVLMAFPAASKNGATDSTAAQTELVVGSSTAILSALASSATATVITIGGLMFTRDSYGAYVVDGQTLFRASIITLGSGAATTRVALQTQMAASVPSNADSTSVRTELVIGSSTTLLPALASTAIALVLSEGGWTFTRGDYGAYIVDGQTIFPGSTITLGSGADTTRVALQTQSLSSMSLLSVHRTGSASALPGIAGYIMTGLGSPGPTTTSQDFAPAVASSPPVQSSVSMAVQASDGYTSAIVGRINVAVALCAWTIWSVCR
jgi:hypothetical protein